MFMERRQCVSTACRTGKVEGEDVVSERLTNGNSSFEPLVRAESVHLWYRTGVKQRGESETGVVSIIARDGART